MSKPNLPTGASLACTRHLRLPITVLRPILRSLFFELRRVKTGPTKLEAQTTRFFLFLIHYDLSEGFLRTRENHFSFWMWSSCQTFRTPHIGLHPIRLVWYMVISRCFQNNHPHALHEMFSWGRRLLIPSGWEDGNFWIAMLVTS